MEGLRFLSLLPVTQDRAQVIFLSFFRFGSTSESNLYRKKGCCHIFLFLSCVLTRQVSPVLEWIINYCRSLYNKNVYFTNEKYPPWRLPGEQEVREGEKQECWPGFQSSLSLSPDVWSWGRHRKASPSGSQLSQ